MLRRVKSIIGFSLTIEISSIITTYLFFRDWKFIDPDNQIKTTLVGLIENALCTVVPFIFFWQYPLKHKQEYFQKGLLIVVVKMAFLFQQFQKNRVSSKFC